MMEAMMGPSRIKDAVGNLFLLLTALLWAADVTQGAPSTSCDCPDAPGEETPVSVGVAPAPPAPPVVLL